MSEPDDETSTDRDRRYEEVSLRAVELLARAQRTADEAVAEAQAYARDLEVSARAQYSEILHRAQVAAREMQRAGSAATPPHSEEGAPPPLLTEEIDYVRTYAKVAHAQLKTVLDALTGELDNLAEVAAGRASDEMVAAYAGGDVARGRDAAPAQAPSPVPQASPSTAIPEREREQPAPASREAAGPAGHADSAVDSDAAPQPAQGASSDDDRVWPAIFDAEAADEIDMPSTWRNSYQPR